MHKISLEKLLPFSVNDLRHLTIIKLTWRKIASSKYYFLIGEIHYPFKQLIKESFILKTFNCRNTSCILQHLNFTINPDPLRKKFP